MLVKLIRFKLEIEGLVLTNGSKLDKVILEWIQELEFGKDFKIPRHWYDPKYALKNMQGLLAFKNSSLVLEEL